VIKNLTTTAIHQHSNVLPSVKSVFAYFCSD